MPQKLLALVADDQPHILLTLEYLLRSLGTFEVLTATNGQDAVALASSRRPDLVMLDVMMPLIDGYAACQAIRQAWAVGGSGGSGGSRGEHRGQVWIITARGSNLELDQARQAGADRVITKPFDPDLVLRQVRESFQPQTAA